MTAHMLRRRFAGAICTAVVLGAPPAVYGDDLERCAKVAQALMREFCATASDYTLTASAEGGLRINIFKRTPVGGEGQVQFTEQDHRGEVKGLASADQRANLESIRACMQPHISAVLTAVFECRGNSRPSASRSPRPDASRDHSRHGRDDEMDSERSRARETLTLFDRQRRTVLDGRAQVWMTRAREWGSARHHVAVFPCGLSTEETRERRSVE